MNLNLNLNLKRISFVCLVLFVSLPPLPCFGGEPRKTKAEEPRKQESDKNLVSPKARAVNGFTKNGRSATVKVVPGKSYLVSVSAKLNAPTTNPDPKLRLVIQEKGKRGMKVFDWHRLTFEAFAVLSAMYTAPEGIREITVILKPALADGEKGSYRDFTVTEVSGDLDE